MILPVEPREAARNELYVCTFTRKLSGTLCGAIHIPNRGPIKAMPDTNRKYMFCVMENKMLELTKDQFFHIAGLFPALEGYLEPRAVAAGNNPGWIFADSVVEPHIALVYSHGNEGFYLLGAGADGFANEINVLIDGVLTPRLAEAGKKSFEFSSVPPATDAELAAILERPGLGIWKQCVYIYRKNTLPQMPEDIRVYDVKDVLTGPECRNKDFVEGKILSYWERAEDLLALGGGFCAKVGDMAVSIAVTGWVWENYREISIETVKGYRRKGYARACAIALIHDCVSKGLIPYWECEAANTASALLAESLGFEKLFDYDLYGFDS